MTIPNFAKFRNRIVIEKENSTADDMGGRTTTWSTYTTAWAQVAPASGSERFFGQRIESNITHKVYLRRQVGITAAMRVKFVANGSTRYLYIQASMNDLEQNKFTLLLCKEGVGS